MVATRKLYVTMHIINKRFAFFLIGHREYCFLNVACYFWAFFWVVNFPEQVVFIIHQKGQRWLAEMHKRQTKEKKETVFSFCITL